MFGDRMMVVPGVLVLQAHVPVCFVLAIEADYATLWLSCQPSLRAFHAIGLRPAQVCNFSNLHSWFGEANHFAVPSTSLFLGTK